MRANSSADCGSVLGNVPPGSFAPPPVGPAVAARGLTLAYERTVVLNRTTLTIPSGTLTGLLGPPGSGKSTLLRAILGRQEPWAGELRVLGAAPGAARPKIGFAPPLTGADWRFPICVGEAVLLGRFGSLGPLRRPRAEDRQAVAHALAQVGLDRLAEAPVSTLSAGQRRRLLLARALARRPALLLLDETLDGLDQASETELARLLNLLRQEGTTVVLATRELGALDRRFDWLVLLGGTEALAGPPTTVATGQNLRQAFGERRVWSLEPVERFALDRDGQAE
jgi:ABC-type Mn2+/Zn2+ transport system ATPase subunit